MRILNIDSRIYLLAAYKHSIKTRRRISKTRMYVLFQQTSGIVPIYSTKPPSTAAMMIGIVNHEKIRPKTNRSPLK